MSVLAPILQAVFTDRLIRQRQASADTIAVDRDTFRILLEFATRATGLAPNQLDIADRDAGLVPRSAASRNHRLAYRLPTPDHPL